MNDQKLYVVEGGKRRKAVEVVCQGCKNRFLAAEKNVKRGRGKFCSRQCVGKAGIVTVDCCQCHKKFEKKKASLKSSRSGLYFCSRICKDTAQRIGGVKEIQPPHYGSSKTTYRKLFESDDFVCQRCGYDEFNCGVDVHHIDGDRTNNDKKNLMCLCACCHRALHNNCWKVEGVAGRSDLSLARTEVGSVTP